MKKTESLMGTGLLQSTKTGVFGGNKPFEVKYQLQLETEENGSGIINGFLRIFEKQKINPGIPYLLELNDKRRCQIMPGGNFGTNQGLVTYQIKGTLI